MGTPGKPTQNVWHVSRGFVFAEDNRVVYPRLPTARYHGTSAPENTSPVLPPTSRLENDEGQSAVVGINNGHAPVVEHQKPAADELAGTAETSATAQELAEEEDDIPCHPPVTDLDFKIPEDLFQAALNAPKGSPRSFWSYNLYRGPGEDGTQNQKVKVHYCTSRHTTERVLQRYFMNEKVLGFDLEWESEFKGRSPRRNVSLVQLASASRIGLFHVALYPEKDDLVAPSLRKIMEDPNVTKTGVWISGDCTRLRTYLGIDSRGTFELSHLYKVVKYSESGQPGLVNKRLVSLANQIQDCMHLPLFKGMDVRASKWSEPLDHSQVVYSASDAYAAVQLFAVLDRKRRSLDPVPPLPHHAELKLPIALAHTLNPTEDDEIEISLSEDESEEDIVAFVKETLSVEDADTKTTVTTTTTTTVRRAPVAPKRKQTQPQDARVAEAELWAKQHCLEHKNAKTAPYALRAYYLWHKNGDLVPEEIAVLLRDPPLATSTVVNYITNSIGADKLPFDKRRLREEVLEKFPKTLLGRGRLKDLVRACREDPKQEGQA
ncbi:hypothetical protein OQA88_4682 [Cercophora sp. LCS_1]